MDDARIRQLQDEVMGRLRRGGGSEGRSLESRVAALEEAVARLTRTAPSPVVAALPCPEPQPPIQHPSAQLLKVVGSVNGMCVLEPDKPCNNSGACRTFGY